MSIRIPNPLLQSLESDDLYHLGYSKTECKEKFSDVKIVVTGGSRGRMKSFAEHLAPILSIPVEDVKDINRTDRYSLFKVGSVLSISHGMGVPSMSIMLHELIKLLKYAEVTDPVIIRMGTSGGIGLDPGTVVVTNKNYNAYLEEEHRVVVLGKEDFRVTTMDQGLAKEVYSHQCDDDGYSTVLGATMCTDGFYEGQARLDGAICTHTEKEKMSYLQMLKKEKKVCNIEMESTALSSMCWATNIKCAIVCVTLLDRLSGDQIDEEMLAKYEKRPQELICRFIKSRLIVTA